VPVAMQEHAEEMRVGSKWQYDPKLRRLVVAVLSSIVYVAQKLVAFGWRMKWRRQLSCWQSRAEEEVLMAAPDDVAAAVENEEVVWW
jgi:hypothetical protein